MKTLLTFVLVIALATSGCTTYSTVRYSAERVEFANGAITIVVTETIDEERLAKLPDGIQFWVRVSEPDTLTGFTVEGIQLTGVTTGSVFGHSSTSGREPRV